MISPASLATIVDVAELATSAPVAAPAATPFDAIMALESLAATCNALCPEALAGVVEGLAESSADGEEVESEEGEDEELGALEFLAALLNTPLPFRPQIAGEPDAGAQAADSPVTLLQSGPRTEAGTPFVDSTDSILEQVNDVSPDKLLAIAAQAATAVDGPTTALEGTVDPAAQLARGADLFAHATRHAAGPERAGIATSMRDPRWAEEFSTRMTMMVRGGESQASLQLSPVDLGPMDVNVSVRNSDATIHFGAANAETRALIEASLPRLREMLAAQGFNLMDASVSQGFARQSQSGNSGSAGGAGVPSDSEAEMTVSRMTAAGLLDLYA
jgi:flagellar hook-length control protein FliK